MLWKTYHFSKHLKVHQTFYFQLSSQFEKVMKNSCVWYIYYVKLSTGTWLLHLLDKWPLCANRERESYQIIALSVVPNTNVTKFIVNYPCLFQRLQSVKCLLWLPKKTLNHCKTHLHACCNGACTHHLHPKRFWNNILLGTQFTLV